MSGQVIFIDDEAAIRQAVQQWLELSGFQVRTFSARGKRCRYWIATFPVC